MISPLDSIPAPASASGNSTTNSEVQSSYKPPAEVAIESFIGILNRGATEEMPRLFQANADVVFTDAHMTIEEYTEEMKRACQAFPDLSFTWQSVEAIGTDQAVVRGLRAQGTHKGPYGFGPYPTIEPTHIVCKNDPEEVTVWVSPHGQIRKALFVPKGQLTGPPGFYTQIGGIIF